MVRAPTMIDVAKRAGVALKTVSRFVNGATNIDPLLAARIADAIRDLGYRRNLAAASIRPGQSSNIVGLVIGDISNPYYSALTRAIERVVRPRGYMLFVTSSEERPALLNEIVSRYIEQRIDGLIVVPPRGMSDELEQHAGFLPPTVLIDRPHASGKWDTVISDNYGGAYRATTVLRAKAGSRIAFVGDSFDIFTMAERLRGFTASMNEAGHVVPQDMIIETARTTDLARHVILDMLTGSTRPDALFCANNRSTIGALLAFGESGIRLPIIGFDDFEGAAISEPRTSVVSQDIDGLGSTATNLLFDRLEGSTADPQQVTLATALILRESHLAIERVES